MAINLDIDPVEWTCDLLTTESPEWSVWLIWHWIVEVPWIGLVDVMWMYDDNPDDAWARRVYET